MGDGKTKRDLYKDMLNVLRGDPGGHGRSCRLGEGSARDEKFGCFVFFDEAEDVVRAVDCA